MSCPTESTRLLYAEDELEPTARRELDAHLVGCRACRERVVSLREEGRLLGDVLREEAPARPAPAPELAAEPPGTGVALGVPITIAAVTAALAAASALVEARLPGSWDLLHPRRLKGAYEMAFDLIFLLRENAPGLIELALAVGGVASVSALLSFAVSSVGRRLERGTLVLAALLLSPLVAHDAAGFELHRDDLRIESDARVGESVVAWGERVDVDGVIDGDLIAASERVTVRGEITGSLYVFARELEVTGKVGGGVHVMGERVRLEGDVADSVFAFAEEFSLASAGRAARDVNLVAENAVLSGEIARDLHVVGDRLDLRGRVGRNVQGHRIRELELRDGAHIEGDVRVSLEDDREVRPSPGAFIGGELRAELSQRAHRHYLEHYKSWRFYVFHGVWFAAAFVFGLVAYQFAPRLFRGSVVTGWDLLRTLGLGSVVLVIAPLAMVVTALTVVGIPVAAALFFVYLAALYTADLAVAAWIGRLILPPADAGTLAFGKSLAAGLLPVSLVAMVPFLGPAVGLVALLVGLGLICAQTRDYLLVR